MNEFDEVFQQLESPTYPATCDQCGEEGTNASLEGHVCQPGSESPAQRAGKDVILDDLFIRPLPDTSKWLLLTSSDWPVAEAYTQAEAEQLKNEHNQHSTLLAQRDRLLRLLRPVTSPTSCYCAVMGDEKCWHCEARELIATTEREG